MNELMAHAQITAGGLLAFLRFVAFFVVSPFPGAATPATARVALAAALAWAFAGDAPLVVSGTQLWVAAAAEILFGLTAGFLFLLVFQTFVMSGEVVGHQMGLGTPGFIDPALNNQVTLMGQTFGFIALGVFALGDGPGLLLAFLQHSVRALPPGVIAGGPSGLAVVTRAGAALFVDGVRVAAPLIAAVFAAQLILAVLARAVPTLNLFVEGPGLTVATGILGFIASIHTFAPLVNQMFAGRLEDVARWLIP